MSQALDSPVPIVIEASGSATFQLTGSDTTDVIDIGIYGNYYSSGIKYAGLFRDATDGIWKLFTDSTTEQVDDVFPDVSAVLGTIQLGLLVLPDIPTHTTGTNSIVSIDSSGNVKKAASNVTINAATGDVGIVGNLNVTGDINQLTLNDIIVTDPLIKMADANTGDNYDIGFYGEYVNAGTKWAGLVRNYTDGIFRLFTDLTVAPTATTVGTVTAVLASLELKSCDATTLTDGTATLTGGALTGLTNLTVDNINANLNTINATSGNLILTCTSGAVEINNNVGIGISTMPKGGEGWAKFGINGTASSSAGPHIQYTVDGDNYPVFQQLNSSHDDITLAFDSYYNGAWRSSDAGSNFAIRKDADTFDIIYDSGIAAGSILTWNTGLVMNTSGNVGIGATPGYEFDIQKSSQRMFWTANTVSPYLKIQSSSGPHAYIQAESTVVGMGSATNYPVVFKVNDDEKMRIDTNGNVGIGTTSPSASTRLHLRQDADTNLYQMLRLQNANTGTTAICGLTITGGANEIAQIYVGGSGNSTIANNMYMVNQQAGTLSFGTSNTPDRMLMDSSGRLGIGITPGTSAQLQVSSDSSVRAQIYAESSHSTLGPALILQGSHQWHIASNKSANGGGANTLQFYDANSSGDVYFNTTGGLGIGATPTTVKLKVYDTANQDSFQIYNTEGTFSGTNIVAIDTRTATTAYKFIYLASDAGGDAQYAFYADGTAYCDNRWDATGADYAEYFESVDGKTIEKGTCVVLENKKVRSYDDQKDQPDDIIGVSRPKEWGQTSASVGNSAHLKWSNKYITNEWGIYELEDYNVYEWKEVDPENKENIITKEWVDYEPLPDGETLASIQAKPDVTISIQQKKKLNPAYDPSVEYIPRSERVEWILVGLLGQVPIRSDQTVNPRWRKMEEITPTVWQWMIR